MNEYLFIMGMVAALFGGVVAAIARNLFHAALGLALTLAGTAVLFIPLGGELISVIQILVYLGAVAISILFILMLSPPFYLKRGQRNVLKLIVSVIITGIVAVPLMSAAMSVNAVGERAYSVPTVQQIGRVLLTDFVFPFEIMSVLLTVAIIGAIVIARDLPEDKQAPQAQAVETKRPEEVHA
ncbi:MAG: NADH-quinone oxidoreductase subunit J [Calditrichaeota bacterium]|nr:NADH-quinone oxidoreductase subunit J [Calditrichota bacterium]